MGTITTRETSSGVKVETETFTFDDTVIIEHRWDTMTITETLTVDDLSEYGDKSDTVSIGISKRKEYTDGSTDFDNFRETLFVTKAQALAFAFAIIKECS